MYVYIYGIIAVGIYKWLGGHTFPEKFWINGKYGIIISNLQNITIKWQNGKNKVAKIYGRK